MRGDQTRNGRGLMPPLLEFWWIWWEAPPQPHLLVCSLWATVQTDDLAPGFQAGSGLRLLLERLEEGVKGAAPQCLGPAA